MALSLSWFRHLALKGPHAIAQGNALGCADVLMTSPERAKPGSTPETCPTGPTIAPAVSPFQGWSWKTPASQGIALGYLIRPLRGRASNSSLTECHWASRPRSRRATRCHACPFGRGGAELRNPCDRRPGVCRSANAGVGRFSFTPRRIGTSCSPQATRFPPRSNQTNDRRGR